MYDILLILWFRSTSYSPSVTAIAFSDNLLQCVTILLVRKLLLKPSLNHSDSPLKTITPCFIHSGYEEQITPIFLHLSFMYVKTSILSPLIPTPFKKTQIISIFLYRLRFCWPPAILIVPVCTPPQWTLLFIECSEGQSLLFQLRLTCAEQSWRLVRCVLQPIFPFAQPHMMNLWSSRDPVSPPEGQIVVLLAPMGNWVQFVNSSPAE